MWLENVSPTRASRLLLPLDRPCPHLDKLSGLKWQVPLRCFALALSSSKTCFRQAPVTGPQLRAYDPGNIHIIELRRGHTGLSLKSVHNAEYCQRVATDHGFDMIHREGDRRINWRVNMVCIFFCILLA